MLQAIDLTALFRGVAAPFHGSSSDRIPAEPFVASRAQVPADTSLISFLCTVGMSSLPVSQLLCLLASDRRRIFQVSPRKSQSNLTCPAQVYLILAAEHTLGLDIFADVPSRLSAIASPLIESCAFLVTDTDKSVRGSPLLSGTMGLGKVFRKSRTHSGQNFQHPRSASSIAPRSSSALLTA